MSTIIELVNSTPVHGGLTDGYRRSQLGQPTGTVGQPPRFRGETNTPGQPLKAPPILSSSARQDRGTNVTIPYPRVVPAEELVNKGRLSPGDVAFLSRFQLGITGQVRMNNRQSSQVTKSVSTPHASISRLAGVDYINRALGPTNYSAGSTVLVNSNNPLDDWRSLGFLNEWTLDGVVMSNDSPGYTMSTTADARNDQLFNMCVQGTVQLNNGYVDDTGAGVNVHYDFRSNAETPVSNLVAGPFYHQYPLQMFDRKIRPGTDLFVGLICRKIEGEELAALKRSKPGVFTEGVEHVHVFQYVYFSARQVYQFAENADGSSNVNIVDSSTAMGGVHGERASSQRGPLDPKRKRNEQAFLPRKRQNINGGYSEETFLGIKKIEVEHMVGAWRIGRVIDSASQRKQGYMGGPIDTASAVTLNLDVSFMDWRALRRTFRMNIFGRKLEEVKSEWTMDLKTGTFPQDDGRVMMWPTSYLLYDGDVAPADNENIPVNPVGIKDKRLPNKAYDSVESQRETYSGTFVPMYNNAIRDYLDDNVNKSVFKDSDEEDTAPGPRKPANDAAKNTTPGPRKPANDAAKNTAPGPVKPANDAAKNTAPGPVKPANDAAKNTAPGPRKQAENQRERERNPSFPGTLQTTTLAPAGGSKLSAFDMPPREPSTQKKNASVESAAPEASKPGKSSENKEAESVNKPREKAAESKAASKPAQKQSMGASGSSTPKPVAESKAPPKKAASSVGTIGSDMLASIFGASAMSSTPAPTSKKTDEPVEASDSAAQPAKFPRRPRD